MMENDVFVFSKIISGNCLIYGIESLEWSHDYFEPSQVKLLEIDFEAYLFESSIPGIVCKNVNAKMLNIEKALRIYNKIYGSESRRNTGFNCLNRTQEMVFQIRNNDTDTEVSLHVR